MATTKKTSGPMLPNLEPLFQAGIDPVTGLPLKIVEQGAGCFAPAILKNLRVMDETQKVNLYKWYNLPDGIDGNLIERILYFKGQAALFYNDIDGKFYFLPFALQGTIDVYGRYEGITPLPFNGTAKDAEDAWIVGLTRKPCYDLLDKEAIENPTEACVILRDYTQAISQTITPRSQLNNTLLTMMSEAIPFARTSLLAHSGIKAIRVNDESDANEVEIASRNITDYALSGKPFLAIKSPLEFQDLTEGGGSMQSEEYFMYYQALDNMRKGFLGLPGSGVFEKKAHTLQSEQDMNKSADNLVLQDGLELRQKFCQIANTIWGLGIWCEANEIEEENTMTMEEEEGNEETNNKANNNQAN